MRFLGTRNYYVQLRYTLTAAKTNCPHVAQFSFLSKQSVHADICPHGSDTEQVLLTQLWHTNESDLFSICSTASTSISETDSGAAGQCSFWLTKDVPLAIKRKGHDGLHFTCCSHRLSFSAQSCVQILEID